MLKYGCLLAAIYFSLFTVPGPCLAQLSSSTSTLPVFTISASTNQTTSIQSLTTKQEINQTNSTSLTNTSSTTTKPPPISLSTADLFNSTTTAPNSSTTTSERPVEIDVIEDLAVYVVSFFLIFGGVVPYIPQYRIISKTHNAHGFSSYVCLTMFISSVLRILFWFGHKFEPALLIQSIVMILATLVMLELCVRVDRERLPPDQRNKKITDLNPMHFWKWSNFSSYLIFLSIIVAVLSLLTSLLVSYRIYDEIIGFISVIAEVLLSVPQFYRNYTNKSTKGMSVSMIFLWIIGDFSKTIYFIIRQSPIQFVICGCLQILINMAIIGQAIFYSTRAKTTANVEVDVSGYNLMRY